MPPYVIFHDTTLEAMAEQQPLTREEFAALLGVGEKKLERYAAMFIEVIEGHAITGHTRVRRSHELRQRRRVATTCPCWLPIRRRPPTSRWISASAGVTSIPHGGAIGAHSSAVSANMQPIVETPAYLAAARGVLSDAERSEVVSTVAKTPMAGVALGGGIRKLRIARPGRGKSAGARVVYLVSGEDIPVFLLTVFAKNERSNLGARERAGLVSAAKQMVEDYRRNR